MEFGKVLQKTCLRQHFSLRRQLLTSFGTAAFITLSFVVAVSITSLNRAGNLVSSRSSSVMRDRIHSNVVETTISSTETFHKFLQNYEGLVQKLAEITQDRIVGYPEPGWEEDRYVPFFDMESQKNIYPLKLEPVPLEWQLKPDITEENVAYVLPQREDWLDLVKSFASYATASFFVQGQCDPSATSGPLHYPNCSDENNNMEKGGAVNPTNTTKGLYEKSGDLGLLMRPLFEVNSNIATASIYFLNSGAGAYISYPGFFVNGAGYLYESIGCDYLFETVNQYTGKPFLSEEDVKRCRTNGTKAAHGRDFNPLERWWFREIVLNHGKVTTLGPHRAIGLDVMLITLGKAVFDRRTGELIGVVVIDIPLRDFDKNLGNARLYEHSEWAIVHIENGQIFADSRHSVQVDDAEPGEKACVTWMEQGLLSQMSFMNLKMIYTELFSSKWTQESLIAAAAASVENCPYGLATAYPLPIPPKEYDPLYKPTMLAIQIVPEEAYSPIDEIESSIDGDVLSGSLIAAGIGLFGMVVILAILWCVAGALTQPLLWMELVSWRIVNHGDKRSGDDLCVEENDALSATVRCSPRTEITELVEEFRCMIKGFSGEGASSVAEPEANEVRNTLTWQSDFRQLYTKELTRTKSIQSNRTTQTPTTDPEDSQSGCSENPDEPVPNNTAMKQYQHRTSPGSVDGLNHRYSSGSVDATRASGTADATRFSKLAAKAVFPAPPKQHIGPVAARIPEDRMSGFDQESKTVYRSRLFRGIVLLIVFPLILTNFAITVIVTRRIVETVPSWVEELSAESLDLEVTALTTIAHAKAALVNMIVAEPVHDLLWASRVAGWLFFGAASRSDSFTEVNFGSEECKKFEPYTCTVYKEDRYQCPCDWNDTSFDKNGATCTKVNSSESRRLQKRFFEVLAQDIGNNSTGSRTYAFSFNESAFSPETTIWRNDTSRFPGAERSLPAAGFNTTYDRAKVSSAMAVVDFPLYNYQVQSGRSRQQLGIYLGFEADGSFTGFAGCGHINTGFAHFNSNQDNKAFEIAPDLCPEGKFGFDPRCRNWYSATRDAFLKSRTMVHITAPYVFIDGKIGLSAATPLANPATGEFGGVMLLNFDLMGLLEAFASVGFGRGAHLGRALTYVITPEEDVYGGDTVVSPNKTKDQTPSSILEELLPHDAKDSKRRKDFETNFLTLMKSGVEGSGYFYRSKADGQPQLMVTVFVPVGETIASPMDPRSFVGGVNLTSKLVYSVGIASCVEQMRLQFEQVEKRLYSDLGKLAIIDTVLVVFLSIVFLIIACKITVHVTRPMITLLSAVHRINSKEEKYYSIPPLLGGSREVHQVYNSFSKLYKVVRISNTAFFSGNLSWADHIVNDAIQLFRKIDDRKAIGIACNNLGNIMYARILELGRESESCLNYGFGVCAAQHYNESVAISQEQFERAESVEEKAAFARELADRLFNRGLFFLFMVGESDAPENARERGIDDITRARDLDYDVKEFFIENKLLLQVSSDFFARMIRRIHGLCTHYGDEEIRSIWDPSRLVEEADELLYAAWYEKSVPLFREISRIGRLQQLEAAAIRLEGCKGNYAEAARVGMRMFAEDEYLLEAPFSLAASAILHYAQNGEGSTWSRKTVSSVRSDLRKMTRICRSPTLDLGKCVVFALELNERLEGDKIFPLINSKCMNLFEKHCTDEDFVGIVAYTVNGDYTLELASKAENEVEQRNVLDLATKSTSERVCSALPFAMQIILDSAVSQEMDTYILLFTDGYSWDPGPYLSIKWQIARMNREMDSDIHLIILGVDVEPEHIEECKGMCSVSKGSFFVELTVDNIDETFSSISSIFSTGRLYQQFLSTVTMEKF